MSDGPTLRVKNWREFQHYTDRRPPWIKLHVGLLENYEFQCLPLASRALAPMLWLLASETTDGSIPADPGLLAFRLRWDVNELKSGLTPLIQHGFLIDASGVLAEREQPPLFSVSRDKKKTEGNASGALAFDPASIPGLDVKAWAEWVAYRKDIGKALKPASLKAAAKQMAALGAGQAAAVQHSVANSYQGLFAPKGQPAKSNGKDPYANAL